MEITITLSPESYAYLEHVAMMLDLTIEQSAEQIIDDERGESEMMIASALDDLEEFEHQL